MIADYGDTSLSPTKFGVIHDVFIQATYASSGTSWTLDSDGSSPGVTIARDAAGDVDITFPKGQWVHFVGGGLDLGSDTPDDDIAKSVNPRSLNAAAGTGKILLHANDDGTEVDAPDGARLYVHLKVGRRP